MFALDIKHCYIKDEVKHKYNQKLLEAILEQELAIYGLNGKPIDQANHLSRRITQIANALIKNGFLNEAYEMPKADQQSLIAFNCFALCEGKNKNNSIPLTFFVYVWPSKESALKYHKNDSQNHHYASPIHSHPLPCAFAVLDGTLIQKNYEIVTGQTVRLIEEERFQKGEGDVDDLKNPFIHQLYHPGTSSKLCLSLHAYGLDSAEKVMQCFRETRAEHSYKE